MTGNMDYSDDTLDFVVIDGVRFLHSLTQHYGVDRGMAVWEKLGEAMGPEVKGKVFFAMLTGGGPSNIRIQAGTCTESVQAIKAIRNATDMGLKEAKDAWDLSKTQVVTLRNIHQHVRNDLVRVLRNIGMIVS